MEEVVGHCFRKRHEFQGNWMLVGECQYTSGLTTFHSPLLLTPLRNVLQRSWRLLCCSLQQNAPQSAAPGPTSPQTPTPTFHEQLLRELLKVLNGILPCAGARLSIYFQGQESTDVCLISERGSLLPNYNLRRVWSFCSCG